MYAELYSYLILHKNLPVPGIGTFLLQRHSAVADFPNRKILPPSYSVAFDSKEQTPAMSFYKWLSQALSSSDHEAVTRFNDFAFNLKNQLANGDIINWNDVGTISKGLGGEVKFIPQEKIVLEQPVAAEKVEKKSLWWAAAVVIGLIAVVFLGWYFSENGVEVTSTANSKQVSPIESTATYKLLP
ncbi:MAG: hypothetical protein IPH34_01165 [Chitinophagaceae bacterium]|nr:hypothetical protein [Chitinophagaceae bacterium]